MKQRIIEGLVSFSDANSITNPSEMLIQIAEETGRTTTQIQQQSKLVLKHLLHHYGSFSVETIDHFNHRLIRTFARDLKLSSNFEVSLDVQKLVEEAVDLLVDKAGKDSKITKVLLDFALEKTDDDTSWDITRDIAQAAQLLLNENDTPHLALLKDKNLNDFLNFKTQLIAKKKKTATKIQGIATETLLLIEESGLEHSDFLRTSFPKYLQKIEQGDFNIKFENAWQISFGETPLYTKVTLKNNPQSAETIDALTATFVENFETSKALIFQLHCYQSILKNLTPLSVINLVRQELETIKTAKNIVPISEFNALINSEIKNQPAPFIYERLGEKYRHFFIDEFQDTSLLQWQNLVPLIDNALSQEYPDGKHGSTLLVGDAKQSIYRWRGGLPEQFMALYGSKNPFSIGTKEVRNLATNYRSHSTIISFNNAFFSFISNYFGDASHNQLYTIGNKQLLNSKKGGCVRFEFIQPESKAETHELYAASVLDTIKNVKKNGFTEHDICILTRTKKDGIALGVYLMEHEISIISSETLLLQYSSIVNCLLFTITLSLHPKHEEIKVQLLDFLHEHLAITEEKHSFFSHFLKTTHQEFSLLLEQYGVHFDFQEIKMVSLYESCEYIIRQFNLSEKADAYVFGFMDFVFEFEQQPQAGKHSFLNYWESKKDTASIPASKGVNAVQLMTIHKAKGLEFPIVIFPYADLDLYAEKNAKAWLPWDDETQQFDEVLINYNKEIANYGDFGATLYQKRQNTLELDAINLLYVTLTRAVEQLYIFSTTPKKTKTNTPTKYNQLFVEYLKNKEVWEDSKVIYEFGNPQRISSEKNVTKSLQVSPKFITSSLQNNNLHLVTANALLWETEAKKAIDTGNMLHEIMAQIKYKEDIEVEFSTLKNRVSITTEEFNDLKEKVTSIIMHPQLKHLFSSSEKIVNERDIIAASGNIMRPDRLNFYGSNLVRITDYKTGNPKEKHELQLESYAIALQEIGYDISEKIIIYSNEKGITINKF